MQAGNQSVSLNFDIYVSNPSSVTFFVQKSLFGLRLANNLNKFAPDQCVHAD